MRIVIEESWDSIIPKITGIKKFFLEVRNIAFHIDKNTIIYDKSFLLKFPDGIIRKLIYFLWLNTIFLLKLWQLNDEVVVIGTKYFIPFFRLKNVKYFPVIHDLTAFKHKTLVPQISGLILRIMTRNALKNGDKIITVSETAKQEIAEYFSYPLEKIEVLYNTFSIDTNINLDELATMEKYNLTQKKYILSVSSLTPYKNIDKLILAFNKLQSDVKDIKLIIVGKGPMYDEYSKLTNSNVILAGFVDDEELKVLYRNALIYVFPSIMEGFGIPIIDAQQFGIPIVCTDIPVFHEVAGEQGAIFTKSDADNIRSELYELINNPQKQKLLSEQGSVNVKRFKLENLIQQLKNIIG